MSCAFRFYEPLPSQTQIAILERIRFHLPFILILVLSLKVMWPKSPMPSIHHCPVSQPFCATKTFADNVSNNCSALCSEELSGKCFTFGQIISLYT